PRCPRLQQPLRLLLLRPAPRLRPSQRRPLPLARGLLGPARQNKRRAPTQRKGTTSGSPGFAFFLLSPENSESREGGPPRGPTLRQRRRGCSLIALSLIRPELEPRLAWRHPFSRAGIEGASVPIRIATVEAGRGLLSRSSRG